MADHLYGEAAGVSVNPLDLLDLGPETNLACPESQYLV